MYNKPMCDTFSLPAGYSKSGVTYFAKNSDRSPNEPHLVIHVPEKHHAKGSTLSCTYIGIPQAEYTRQMILFKPSWIWGAEMGVNEAKVAIGNEAVFTKAKRGSPALTGMDLLRLALERSDTAESAVGVMIELLETHGQGGNCGFDKKFFYDNSFLVADPKEAYIMETSGKNYAVVRAQGKCAISNRLTIGTEHHARVGLEANDDFSKRFTEPVFSFFAGARNRRNCVLENLLPDTDMSGQFAVLRRHAPAFDGKEFTRGSVKSVCMHGGGAIGDHTTGSMTAVLRQDKPVTLWCTGASTPCISAFKPVFWGAGATPVFHAPVFAEPAQSMEYWLQRERLHRAVIAGLVDATQLRERIKTLEAGWLAREEQLMREKVPDVSKLDALSREASAQEQALVDEFSVSNWQGIKGHGSYAKYWRKKNLALGKGVSHQIYPAVLMPFILGICLCLFLAGCKTVGQNMTVSFDPSYEAFANPMMGFRPTRYIQDQVFPTGEYVTVCKQYIKYTDLEDSPNDTAQKIIDWSDRAWAGIEQRNLKVVPRIVIVYPDGPDNGDSGYWPQGIDHGDLVGRWTSDVFKQRIVAFIGKLGQAWNSDPRVAAIEAGIWGQWGEHHIWPLKLPDDSDRIPLDLQKAIGDAFVAAFPDKKVMVRYPETFTDYDFGYYWDSFALPDDKSCGEAIILLDNWRRQMISGEVAYDWGDQSKLGGSPDGTLSSTENTDHVINWVNHIHASSLGWISDYDGRNGTVAANAAKLQKALGYRFVVQRAAFNKTVKKGGKLSLEFEVANTGAAPFYYQWPVELSLLDGQKNPAWTGILNVDIRNWRPGHTYTVRNDFRIPAGVNAGTYTLALAVLDPAGNLPSLRFANVNYYNGGRMPLGKIGIAQAPDTDDLGNFDSLYRDRSLYYKLEPSSAPVKDRQVYKPENDPPPLLPQEEMDVVHKTGNLAFQKPVSVSSVESAYQNFPEKAVDGDPKTRWSSEWQMDPSWIAVDLEERTTVSRVNLSWEWSYAKEYEIQVSDDEENWKTVYHTDAGSGNEEEIVFSPVEARHVRVYCIKRALQWGYSLYEVEVYAP